MSIEQTIKQAVTDALKIPYIFGTYPTLNVQLDRLRIEGDFPVCLNIQPTSGRVDVTDGVYNQSLRETSDVTVGFVDAIPLDFEPADIQTQVETLKGLGMKLIAKLNGLGSFNHIDSATMSIGFDQFDANLVMVLFNFSLQQKNGTCIDE